MRILRRSTSTRPSALKRSRREVAKLMRPGRTRSRDRRAPRLMAVAAGSAPASVGRPQANRVRVPVGVGTGCSVRWTRGALRVDVARPARSCCPDIRGESCRSHARRPRRRYREGWGLTPELRARRRAFRRGGGPKGRTGTRPQAAQSHSFSRPPRTPRRLTLAEAFASRVPAGASANSRGGR